MKSCKYQGEGTSIGDGWAHQLTSWSGRPHHEQLCPRLVKNSSKLPHCSRWDTLYLLNTTHTRRCVLLNVSRCIDNRLPIS